MKKKQISNDAVFLFSSVLALENKYNVWDGSGSGTPNERISDFPMSKVSQ